MSGGPTSPQLQRPHLEALLIARAALEQSVADVDRHRLSPAAIALLEHIAEWPTIAVEWLELSAEDVYQARLARRALRFTVVEVGFFSRATLVALVNQLPVLERWWQAAA